MMANDLKLFSIPFARWLQNTIEKINNANVDDSSSWKKYWLRSYRELGGTSSTGAKDCPRLAAYGLWYLGRIVDGGRPIKRWSIKTVDQELGKNAAYAVTTIDLLNQGWSVKNKKSLWGEVRNQYKSIVGKEAANGEQGAIRVATILFNEDLIMYPEEQNGSYYFDTSF